MTPEIPNIPDGMAPDTFIQYLRNSKMYRSADEVERKYGKASLSELQELSAKIGGDPITTLGSSSTEDWLEKFITINPEMLRLKHQARKLVNISDPVLIQGETGTGKELIARALHGSRPGKFIAVNCTSLPSELIESELFGHVRGAFTGAFNDRRGKFREALDGTIFLDEIGDMPYDMQSKLLRVLQERIVIPIGCEKEIDVSSVRVISATNILDLNTKGFRSDLLWRLKIFLLKTLPLVSRLEDVRIYLETKAPKFYEKLTPGYFDREFEGNYRELNAHIRRWEILGEIPE